MRCGLFLIGLLLIGLLSGCVETPRDTGTTSILTFRYDAARDMVIASTHPLVTDGMPVPAQRYADMLAGLPAASYSPTPTIHLADPVATVAGNVVTVNYREVAGLDQLSSAQLAGLQAVLKGWWWVPGITSVRLELMGVPATSLGSLAITQPLAHLPVIFVVQPTTGELGYLVGVTGPNSPAQAVTALARREIRELPAQAGFRPLLPPDVTLNITPERMMNGILPVDIVGPFDSTQSTRLAGIVLMFNQYPNVNAVQLTFNGNALGTSFMRTRLDRAIVPQDLLLPEAAGATAGGPTLAAISSAVAGGTRRVPPPFACALTWQGWARVETPADSGAPRLFVLREEVGKGYVMLVSGSDVSVIKLLKEGIPPEAIIALRLPGWEMVAAAE